jgi:hypothetical protein
LRNPPSQRLGTVVLDRNALAARGCVGGLRFAYPPYDVLKTALILAQIIAIAHQMLNFL